MRTKLLFAVLATLSLAATAQAIYFEPSRANPKGGDVIRIHLDNTYCQGGCTTAPQVFFDFLPATNVTLIDPYTLEVTTPPHNTGVVDVRIGSRTLQSAFGYELPRERLLIPLLLDDEEAASGAYGTRWATELWVHNSDDKPVRLNYETCGYILGPTLMTPCGDYFSATVPANTTARLKGNSYTTIDYPFRYFNPPVEAGDNLTYDLRLYDRSHPEEGGTSIPIVRERDLRHGTASLLNVPATANLRKFLRVYATPIFYPSFTVSVYDMESGALLAQRGLERTFPYPTDSGPPGELFSTSDIFEVPVVRAAHRLRVEIAPHQATLGWWAMLTLTDNTTQKVTVLTPQ